MAATDFHRFAATVRYGDLRAQLRLAIEDVYTKNCSEFNGEQDGILRSHRANRIHQYKR